MRTTIIFVCVTLIAALLSPSARAMDGAEPVDRMKRISAHVFCTPGPVASEPVCYLNAPPSHLEHILGKDRPVLQQMVFDNPRQVPAALKVDSKLAGLIHETGCGYKARAILEVSNLRYDPAYGERFAFLTMDSVMVHSPMEKMPRWQQVMHGLNCRA